jgi:2-oxoglutarate ferredoxin oxidoreductase subunit alpha
MIPVIVLTDGYLANGAEPWRIPELDELGEIPVTLQNETEGFEPYARDPKTLARPWALPGTPGLEHRIGGLEKQDVTGNVSYDPENHQRMTDLRAQKVARIADTLPDLEVEGDPEGGKLLVLGWGSTGGAITGAVREARSKGYSVSRAHLRHLNPLPKNLGDVLDRFEQVLLPELNCGQLALLLRARFLKDIQSLQKVQGKPFHRGEIYNKIVDLLDA